MRWVVVMSTESRGLPQAIVALLAVDALGIPVFFAGSAFEPEHSWRQLPGRYLGTRMEGARTPAHRHAGTSRGTPIKRQSGNAATRYSAISRVLDGLQLTVAAPTANWHESAISSWKRVKSQLFHASLNDRTFALCHRRHGG